MDPLADWSLQSEWNWISLQSVNITRLIRQQKWLISLKSRQVDLPLHILHMHRHLLMICLYYSSYELLNHLQDLSLPTPPHPPIHILYPKGSANISHSLFFLPLFFSLSLSVALLAGNCRMMIETRIAINTCWPETTSLCWLGYFWRQNIFLFFIC